MVRILTARVWGEKGLNSGYGKPSNARYARFELEHRGGGEWSWSRSLRFTERE